MRRDDALGQTVRPITLPTETSKVDSDTSERLEHVPGMKSPCGRVWPISTTSTL